MQLHVASVDASFYPDVFVRCDSRDRTADTDLMQRHPHWVVEVLSDSTAAIDRGPKVEAFRSLETPEAHRLVKKDRPHADLFVRNAEGLWALNPAGEGGTLTIVALGVELSMAAVYECVAFEVRACAAA